MEIPVPRSARRRLAPGATPRDELSMRLLELSIAALSLGTAVTLALAR